MNIKENNAKLIRRPPIVVVLGHVDHGKSSLLDFIRKTNVVAKEVGGITQSIGAYEIKVPQEPKSRASETSRGILRQAPQDNLANKIRKITFIDTPGHEAFWKMRARGAKVADLAILVVAADDGVKPQTIEAIDILKKTDTPFVVAITKIDKPNADVEKTKNELTQAEVLLEGYGGNISWQQVSSKSGEGVNELLDLILLAAEMEDLKYNPEAEARGAIIEAKMDSRRGIVATAIIKDGTLRTGDEIFTPSAEGKVKILENFLGEKVNELAPSSPALILGFENLPQVGEEFSQIEADRRGFLDNRSGLTQREINGQIIEDSRNVINLILKADVAGSLETLSEVVKNLPAKDVKIKIIDESVGEITDGDVKLAQATKAIIVGFNVRANKAAENLARAQEVKIITSEIIYELVKVIEEEISGSGLPKIAGELEVLTTFSRKGKKQLIGGKVISGMIKNKSKLEVRRGEEIIGQGRILNLQHQKQDTAQVEEGKECGIIFESDIVIETGDRLFYKILNLKS